MQVIAEARRVAISISQIPFELLVFTIIGSMAALVLPVSRFLLEVKSWRACVLSLILIYLYSCMVRYPLWPATTVIIAFFGCRCGGMGPWCMHMPPARTCA
jgi:hypothetical protein